MKVVALAVVALSAMVCSAQTIYKCPDANGRLNLQDTPCTGGTSQSVRPATGSDNPAKAAAPTKAVSDKSIAAPTEAERLRGSVGLMSWERVTRQLAFNLRDAEAQKGNLIAQRDNAISAIEQETRAVRSQTQADAFQALQLSKITNVRLDYQGRIAQADEGIAASRAQQQAHKASKPV